VEKLQKLKSFSSILPLQQFFFNWIKGNCWRFYRNLRTIHNRKRAQWRLPIFTHVWKIFSFLFPSAMRTFSSSAACCGKRAEMKKHGIMNNCSLLKRSFVEIAFRTTKMEPI
jgi:hypothetical protein